MRERVRRSPALAALVMTHVVDAADLRAELLLASVVHRLDLAGAVRALYVSSEVVFVRRCSHSRSASRG